MYAMRSHSSFVECILYIISNLWHLSLPLRVPLPFDVKQFQIKNRLNFVFICFAWIRFDNSKVVVVVAQLTPIEPTNKEWINCNSKLSHILCFIYRVYTLRNRRRRSNEHTNEIAISVGSMTTKEQHVLLAQNTISIHVILFDAFECEFWRVAARRTQKAKKKNYERTTNKTVVDDVKERRAFVLVGFSSQWQTETFAICWLVLFFAIRRSFSIQLKQSKE